MHYEWDDAKNNANIAKHGVDFHAIEAMDWNSTEVFTDERVDYGETRYIVWGKISGRLHVGIYTMRGDARRIISLRKANVKEVKNYET